MRVTIEFDQLSRWPSPEFYKRNDVYAAVRKELEGEIKEQGYTEDTVWFEVE